MSNEFEINLQDTDKKEWKSFFSLLKKIFDEDIIIVDNIIYNGFVADITNLASPIFVLDKTSKWYTMIHNYTKNDHDILYIRIKRGYTQKSINLSYGLFDIRTIDDDLRKTIIDDWNIISNNTTPYELVINKFNITDTDITNMFDKKMSIGVDIRNTNKKDDVIRITTSMFPSIKKNDFSKLEFKIMDTDDIDLKRIIFKNKQDDYDLYLPYRYLV